MDPPPTAPPNKPPPDDDTAELPNIPVPLALFLAGPNKLLLSPAAVEEPDDSAEPKGLEAAEPAPPKKLHSAPDEEAVELPNILPSLA